MITVSHIEPLDILPGGVVREAIIGIFEFVLNVTVPGNVVLVNGDGLAVRSVHHDVGVVEDTLGHETTGISWLASVEEFAVEGSVPPQVLHCDDGVAVGERPCA